MAILGTTPAVLPEWTDEAVALLKPVLGVMARPIIVNNIGRAAANPAHLTRAEIPIYLDKVRHGVLTFAGAAQVNPLMAQLEALLARHS